MGTLYSELKRRNVFKVGVAYAVVGWVLIQASDIIAPQLQLPDWAPRLVTFMVLIGFPIALVLAWIFDMTPEGIRVTEGRTANLRFYTIVGVVAAVSIGWFLLGTPADPSHTVDRAAAPSIAVLAFDNMSPDPENAFFAEGISEEILNVLARIDGLRVASRTSAFSFAGSNVPIGQIAEQLGVRHVLEGSVRKQGNQVRITAQLIDAATDSHLWSETYDRSLSDIFQVQEEIANSIARTMRDVLGVRSIGVDAPTEDLVAYELFLRGRQLFYARGTTLDTAIADLEAAVVRDSEFAEAWAFLAASYFVAPGYTTQISNLEAIDRARARAERAIELNPDDPLTLAVMGQMRRYQGDMRGSLELTGRAAGLRSQDSTPMLWHGLTLLGAGYVDEAIVALESAYRADPLPGINNGWLGVAYLAAGRDELAERHLFYAAERGWFGGMIAYTNELAARGQRERAVRVSEHTYTMMRSGVDSDDPVLQLDRARIEAILDPLKAPALYRLAVDTGLVSTIAPEVFALPGLEELFFDAYTAYAALEENTPRIWFWWRSVWQPSNRWIREDPRYFEIARDAGLVELWEARGYPPGCRRVNAPAGAHLSCN